MHPSAKHEMGHFGMRYSQEEDRKSEVATHSQPKVMALCAAQPTRRSE